jgi:hypothetical protein
MSNRQWRMEKSLLKIFKKKVVTENEAKKKCHPNIRVSPPRFLSLSREERSLWIPQLYPIAFSVHRFFRLSFLCAFPVAVVYCCCCQSPRLIPLHVVFSRLLFLPCFGSGGEGGAF